MAPERLGGRGGRCTHPDGCQRHSAERRAFCSHSRSGVRNDPERTRNRVKRNRRSKRSRTELIAGAHTTSCSGLGAAQMLCPVSGSVWTES